MPIIQNASMFVTPGSVNLEPQRQNNFILDLNISGLGLGGESADILSLALLTFPFPEEGNEVKDIRHQNHVVHYAGSFSGIDATSLVYREFVDKRISDLWSRWRAKVGNYRTGGIGFAARYKTTGILYKLPPGNPDDPAIKLSRDNEYTQKFHLLGCFPATYKEGDYSADNDGDQVEITVNLSIDFVLNDAVYPTGSIASG